MDKKYYAFISYKREDEEWAKWLQHKLEHYKLPSNLNGRTDLPKEIRPIFKDTSELNPGNLPQQIHEALEQSKHLIVICSPRSAKSEWVNREVEAFIGMGKTDYIIPFIIEGKAFAKDSDEECFPEALRNLPAEQEILGANIGEMGRDAAAVKVVAQMFGLRFDELWQRYEREQRRKRITSIAIIAAVVLAAMVVAGWIWKQRTEIRMENWAKMENEAKLVAKKANELTNQGQSYVAQQLLLEVLPKNVEKLDRPYTAEAEWALRNAISHNVMEVNNNTYYYNASYSPDGREIVAVSYDTIRILNAANGELVRMLGRFEGVESAEFSPDGKRIVYCAGNTIGIIDADNGKNLVELLGHDDYVFSASYRYDGQKIVSSSRDGTLRVWDAKEGKEIMRLKRCDSNSVSNYGNVAKFSPNGRQILEITDNRVKVWDAEKGMERFVLKAKDYFTSACYTPDGSRIITSSFDGNSTIAVWDANNGRKLSQNRLGSGACVDFSKDGKLVFDAGDLMVLFDTKTGIDRSIVGSVVGDRGYYSGHAVVKFSPDGKQFLTIPDNGYEDIHNGPIEIWNVDVVDDFHELTEPVRTYSDEFSRDGKHIVTSLGEILDTKTGEKVRDLVPGNSSQGETIWMKNYSVSYSPDNIHVVMASGNDVSIWNAETGEKVKKMEIRENAVVNSVSYHPKGEQIVLSFGNGTIGIFDVNTGKQVKLYGETDYEYKDIDIAYEYNFNSYSTFNPDGTRLLSYESVWGSSMAEPTTISILNAENGETVHDLIGHEDRVTSVGFSPDGGKVISSSDDGTIRIWDVGTGGEIARVYIQELWKAAGPEQVAFSFDGKYVVASYADGTACTWRFVALQDLIDQTRERFKDHPLTPEERQQYYLE